MTPIANLIKEALEKPHDAVRYHLATSLRSAFPDLHLLEIDDHFFDVPEFSERTGCPYQAKPHVVSQFVYSFDLDENCTESSEFNAWLEVEWEGAHYEVVTISLRGPHCRESHHFLLSANEEFGQAFFETVSSTNARINDQIMVYLEGWSYEDRLYDQVRETTLDSLVLEGNLKEQLLHEFQDFFAARELYERHKVPWKRGVLLFGSPGNGKTHAIKGLINALGVPALYVKSFQSQYQTDHTAIEEVFKRARQVAPCLLVLEDLDSLVDDGNRSFFLNEMDGFAANTGILTVATTNHPERLDPAILQRPSRFDRKYVFELPGAEGRLQFLSNRFADFEGEMKLSDDELRELADLTVNFSYAYLKELIMGGLMAWMANRAESTFLQAVKAQIQQLREQMEAEEAADEEPAPDERPSRRFGPRWRT